MIVQNSVDLFWTVPEKSDTCSLNFQRQQFFISDGEFKVSGNVAGDRAEAPEAMDREARAKPGEAPHRERAPKVQEVQHCDAGPR